MEVCRKPDNIKLENRPYTEVSYYEKIEITGVSIWLNRPQLIKPRLPRTKNIII